MASYSKVNSPILPEFELFWDFMHVQVICNFHKDLDATVSIGPSLCSVTEGVWA